MAVMADKYGSSLVLELVTGQDEKGNEKTKNKSISKISVNATDEDLYAVGQAISEVLMYPMAAVRRIDKSILLG
ncbi:hypothetical protein BD780_000924 [Clostridium tetanomorphum]|uniref:DUF1659 domain-containing protein n=1 Tax=Clostridium tetanomorphum TaxID=1553 RepID=A0A923EES6_CLOTT|nr:DUF1659 domain-containing protein [Clostridium tetanomorphum]KAJ50137.1 hypothetical protein CTM_18804 [Clostridium tetanomorphum DSM 665]KAJ50922.1 hypothetical protein CTM_15438 [Clostridium tetanomorphum DSM 665]MBC2399768.1 DUF1659 domain-containing protein [Clostridium tetanomorphum]MBP1864252.1 hypothetical protein [Clostridium tetanomorphum]NRS83699.1 hypothetical protein [Clostridium tetanomorphum]